MCVVVRTCSFYASGNIILVPYHPVGLEKFGAWYVTHCANRLYPDSFLPTTKAAATTFTGLVFAMARIQTQRMCAATTTTNLHAPCCFVSINLFVGAIVDNFTRIKQESDGSATMTPEQQQWADSLKATVSAQATISPKKPPDDEPFRKKVFDLVTSEKFNFIVIGVIVANVFAMAFEFDPMPDSYAVNYANFMLFFTYFYYCECTLKMYGLGAFYFQEAWCRFDFFLVCTSFLDQFFSELLMTYLPIPPTILRVMRVARVLRILRLLKNLKGLRDLVFTLVLAFPGLMNVGALLALVMFMYAVLGMNLFTYLMPGGALNEGGRNFVTFGNSMLLLFQCLTGDGWSEMMDDAMVTEERGCDPEAVPTDCGSPIAIPYFISFTVIGSFVMLNLVVAVILENFTALGNVNGDLVSANDIADFKEAWGFYDPDADGMIPVVDLPKLLCDLPPPLGLKGTKEQGRPLKVCLRLGLMQVRNAVNGDPEVAFKPVLDALIQRNYDGKVEVPENPESVDSPAIAALLSTLRLKRVLYCIPPAPSNPAWGATRSAAPCDAFSFYRSSRRSVRRRAAAAVLISLRHF